MRPVRAHQIARTNKTIVNTDSKWIGLNSPYNLLEWIKKPDTATNTIIPHQT